LLSRVEDNKRTVVVFTDFFFIVSPVAVSPPYTRGPRALSLSNDKITILLVLLIYRRHAWYLLSSQLSTTIKLILSPSTNKHHDFVQILWFELEHVIFYIFQNLQFFHVCLVSYAYLIIFVLLRFRYWYLLSVFYLYILSNLWIF
jgi:hypothetical protein